MRPAGGRPAARRGFTLVELLVVVAIVAMLMGMLLPSLGGARKHALSVKCLSNLRQMGNGFQLYAQDYSGRTMPTAYFRDWPMTYWYGRERDADGVDPTRGFLWPYLQSDVREAGVYECPVQPLGTFDRLQGSWPTITTTYGYNGYFLSPATTPGWERDISGRPWQNLDTMPEPQQVFVFADTMIDWWGSLKNCALLDPPFLYSRSLRTWRRNPSPTTSFRHLDMANAVCADGHADSYAGDPDLIGSPEFHIGSVGPDNAPHYVPDWRDW